nr:CASP-like protein 5B2 [Ipomoea trifida]
MKVMFGRPGKASGLVLRIGQCGFAAASLGVMASASGFSIATAFCYLIASMGLQVIWSFILACNDIHALRVKRDLRNHIFMSLSVVGDWVTATLSLGAACSSAGVMVLLARDTTFCRAEANIDCNMFQISIALAFISWFFLAISSLVTFCLAASS